MTSPDNWKLWVGGKEGWVRGPALPYVRWTNIVVHFLP